MATEEQIFVWPGRLMLLGFSFPIFLSVFFLCFAEFMELYGTMHTELCINNVHEVYALPKCIHRYTYRWIGKTLTETV